MHVMKCKVLSLFAVVLCACASGGRDKTGLKFGSEPPAPENAQVDSAAYGSDWFTFRKPMKIRPSSDIDFYFKHCTLTGRQNHFSKSDYFCEYP